MIKLTNIVKSFGEKNVFDHLNFEIKMKGYIYTIIGQVDQEKQHF